MAKTGHEIHIYWTHADQLMLGYFDPGKERLVALLHPPAGYG